MNKIPDLDKQKKENGKNGLSRSSLQMQDNINAIKKTYIEKVERLLNQSKSKDRFASMK